MSCVDICYSSRNQILLMKLMAVSSEAMWKLFPSLLLPQKSSFRKEGLKLLTVSWMESVCVCMCVCFTLNICVIK